MEAVHNIIGGVGGAVNTMLTGPEPIPEAIEAPTPDDLTARTAAEREAQRQYGDAGRAGTMLTNDSKLG